MVPDNNNSQPVSRLSLQYHCRMMPAESAASNFTKGALFHQIPPRNPITEINQRALAGIRFFNRLFQHFTQVSDLSKVIDIMFDKTIKQETVIVLPVIHDLFQERILFFLQVADDLPVNFL